MDREMIFEAMFKTIQESLDWGFDCVDNRYAYYVDGVSHTINAMLTELANKKNAEIKAETDLAEKW